MNSISKFAYSIRVLFVSCALFLFLFSSSAIADTLCITRGPVPIENGAFNASVTSHPDRKFPDFTVRSAIVSLPKDVTGTIDEIVITGPTGEREFGCSKIKNVKNGTNLIQACGGPAVLKSGQTKYFATGSNFSSDDKNGFSIRLCDDF